MTTDSDQAEWRARTAVELLDAAMRDIDQAKGDVIETLLGWPVRYQATS